MFTKPDAKLWIMIHVVFPLLPFAFDAFVRSLIALSVTFDTWSATTLAMSVGLLAIFVSQNIVNSKPALQAGNRDADIRFTVLVFLLGAIVSFVLFGVLVTLEAMASGTDQTQNADVVVKVMSIFILVFSFIPVVMACQAQKAFKLKAVI